MVKKKGGNKMSTLARVININDSRQSKKNTSKYQQSKPLKKLSDHDMKQSMEFKRRSWERD